MARLANRHERQVKLEAVMGVETAGRIIDIIGAQDEEKQDAFLETTLEAAICGADYTECEDIEDMARVYARWFTERYGN